MASDDDVRLRAALCGALVALSKAEVDALLVGGMALRYYVQGEISFDHDVDLLIRGSDVERAIATLDDAGFEVVRTHPTWLFKATLDDATVDVLYVLGKVLRLDDEMLERGRLVGVGSCSARVISREDLAIGQAGASSEAVQELWFQAVELLRSGAVDWDYIGRRRTAAPDRVAALLHYLRSEGVDVPRLDGNVDATRA